MIIKGQVFMDEFDGHGAFAHARSDALGRAMADIAGHENARHAGFKIKRIAIRRPSAGRRPSRIKCWPEIR
jgi:hypothetical protein